jgi:chromosome segregation ATPase
MDRHIRDKELSLEKLKTCLSDEQNKCLYLEQQINEYKLQIKHMNLNGKDSDKEKENQITRLNEEIFKLKSDLNQQMEQKAKETVSKDLNVEELKQTNEKLNQHLNKRNEETKSLKSKLAEQMTRLNEIEHEKLQLNLDWQNKYQYLENIKAQDSEQFTKQILESRDQVKSVCFFLKIVHNIIYNFNY